MAGYKCNVTGSTSSKKVAAAQVATYCADDTSKCVKGAKQMIAFNRESVPLLDGMPRSNLIS
jgi:hypothetical protein